MTTLYYSHPDCQKHVNAPGHPESPERLVRIENALQQEKFQYLQRQAAPVRDDFEQAVLRAHGKAYFEVIRDNRPRKDGETLRLDPDTGMSAGSWLASQRAIGAALSAVDEVVTGKAQNAFCAIRPCGHHAETERAMGFCFFNNVAIAAQYARAKHGLERVAVVDFDVHHGNGTQDIFWDDKDLFFASTHQMPLYPGTGARNETGVGNICNAPLSSGDDGKAFQAAMNERILPGLRNFAPDLVLISAGFDAHAADPLANLRLKEDDFAWATGKIAEIADKHAGGRIVSLLEGGYDLQALARSVAVHVDMLMQAGR